jgi:hypothetical protein
LRAVASRPFHPIVGDEVEVLSEHELLATLDERGEIDALPLMPEMLRFAGQRFRVQSRADTTCIEGDLRRMTDTVHLEGLRCDGSAHGGCQAGCLLFWKEDWLRPVGAVSAPRKARRPHLNVSAGSSLKATDLARAAGPNVTHDGEYYSCQATSLQRATKKLRWWDLRHLIRDAFNRNLRGRRVLRYLPFYIYNRYQTWSKTHLPHWLLIRGGEWVPSLGGVLSSTPKRLLDLEAGERVRVKDRKAIAETLSRDGRNRGLTFDVEMLEYCGQEASVLRRVDRIIDEMTGRMLHFETDSLILDNVVCKATYHGFCNRQTYPFWREIWLERLGDQG